MNQGMTLIVQCTARMITGFVAVFGVYIALTGHLSPGGGFAGGVILAAAGVLVVLAFGREQTTSILNGPACHVWDSVGAMGFLVIALLGYLAGGFFLNFINAHFGEEEVLRDVHHLLSAGTIPISNLAIFIKVAAGLAGAFLALAAFRGPGDRWEVVS
jgi:multicomponent Na+:H+ antiporter subunit B